MGERISISFSVSDNYAQHLAVVMASVLVNNPEEEFVFHILHRNVTEASRAKVKELEAMYGNCKVDFRRIDEGKFAGFKIPVELEHITQEAFFRYILPEELADEKRTIYMDVDMICVGKLRPLWDTELEGNILAMVSEGEAGEPKKRLLGLEDEAPYFNSGLVVMDLAAMREGGYVKKLFDTTAERAGRIAWPDQDVINIVFRNRILALPDKWNTVNLKYDRKNKEVAIWHFAGFLVKPWCNIWKNTTWLLYLKYLKMSPYKDQAARFVWEHIKGFFYFKYTKKRVTRVLVCGVRVWRKKELE